MESCSFGGGPVEIKKLLGSAMSYLKVIKKWRGPLEAPKTNADFRRGHEQIISATHAILTSAPDI